MKHKKKWKAGKYHKRDCQCNFCTHKRRKKGFWSWLFKK